MSLRLPQIFRAAILLSVLVAASESIVASAQGDPPQVSMPALPPGTPPPYLSPQEWPDSLALLPPPPASASAAFARDEAGRTASEALRGSARWNRAASDADLHFPHAPEAFSCAVNFPISPQHTPHLYALMGRTFIDLGLSTYHAKNHYQRVRPFVAHHTTTCLPADEATLRNDGSYPSGHSTVGWGWALLLTELVPERTNEVLERGRDFGQSRVVCNAHWQSDVDAGRIMGAATVARLHANAEFESAMALARTEIAAIRAQNLRPDANACAAEAADLRAEP